MLTMTACSRSLENAKVPFPSRGCRGRERGASWADITVTKRIHTARLPLTPVPLPRSGGEKRSPDRHQTASNGVALLALRARTVYKRRSPHPPLSPTRGEGNAVAPSPNGVVGRWVPDWRCLLTPVLLPPRL